VTTGAPWVSRVRPGWEAKAHLGRILYFQGAPWANFLFPRCTLAHLGVPWHIKVRLGFPGCTLGSRGAPWKAKAHLVPILYFQAAPWAHFLFPRCTLARQGAPWHVKVHLDAPRHIKVRLEFPGCALGAKAHPGMPRRTLAPFCVSKVHLGRILYFQGAPWHFKAHLGTSRRNLAH